MATTIDEISPAYIGEDRLTLSLDNPQEQILAHVPFQVNVDYSGADPEGVQLPLELVIQGPKAGQRRSRLFTRSIPNNLLLVANQGGNHSITLKECLHNRWQGRLSVVVEGEDLQTELETRT